MKNQMNQGGESISMSRRNFLNLMSATALSVAMTACGGSSGGNNANETGTIPDTTAPSIRTITAPGGAAVVVDANGNYVLPAVNLGTSNSYTVTFDEKIGGTPTAVYLNSSGTVITPTGVTVTVTANDASNLTYTVNIATGATYDFSVSKVKVSFADIHANSMDVNFATTINDVPPVSGGAFAALADTTVGDNYGATPITPIDAGGVTDSLGRAIVYSDVNNTLPTGISIDPNTGVISGTHDAFGTETYTVTVGASNGTSHIQKTFVLTIQDNG